MRSEVELHRVKYKHLKNKYSDVKQKYKAVVSSCVQMQDSFS